MKKIVYTIIDNGIDGLAKSSIIFASFDEKQRDKNFENRKNKAYLRKNEEIVDVEEAEKKAKQKLNAIDKLILGLE